MKTVSIINFEGRYSITDSNDDYEKVWSHLQHRFIKPNYSNKHGYTTFSLRAIVLDENGEPVLNKKGKPVTKSKTIELHKLVAQAFVPNDDPEHKTEVNHIDEDKRNNSIDNLEWVTHCQNINHGTRNLRVGDKHKKKVLCVETGQVFDSIKDASSSVGVNYAGISNAVRGRQKTAGNYHWEYAA